MSARLDLAGKKFGRLTVIEVVGRKDQKLLWRCECECGGEKRAIGTALNRGRVLSCGCLVREKLAERNHRHGMYGTPTYLSWRAMIQRCTNKRHRRYADYGGRGIKVCQRWLDSFEAFLEDMGERPNFLTLDRRDVDGNYEPGNCRWATAKTQNNNQRPRRRRKAQAAEPRAEL